ncbi:MAG: glucose-1-phosphate adenylyltransferase subunit GlgD [Oscillospiraceae bacterium]|nr:glucose-1-phosphate adenylyltransferase subunit GlgD [Oscillospiraceae bacterium]
MFLDAMGLILADNNKISLGELSKPRALAAIPFGGRYRIIDYMLSCMVNSGIKSVGILTLNKYKSLMDHLGTGASWDLDRKNFGLHILPPYVNSESKSTEDGEEMAGLLDFIRSNRTEFVILANSNIVINTTFNDFIDVHVQSGADMSVMYNKDGTKYGTPNFIFETDKKRIITDVLFNPEKTDSNRCCIGVITLRRTLLIDLIAEMMAHGDRNFGIYSLLKKFDTLRIRAYEYKGLVLRINNIQTYFNASMQLLDDKVRSDLFWTGAPVLTKVKDEAPTLYFEACDVKNALVSDGCRIMGKVSNSILFRGVTVSKNSVVRNAVIMQDVHISDNCVLDHVILDKNAVIRPGTQLVGHKDYPVVIDKGAIV